MSNNKIKLFCFGLLICFGCASIKKQRSSQATDSTVYSAQQTSKLNTVIYEQADEQLDLGTLSNATIIIPTGAFTYSATQGFTGSATGVYVLNREEKNLSVKTSARHSSETALNNASTTSSSSSRTQSSTLTEKTGTWSLWWLLILPLLALVILALKFKPVLSWLQRF
ncbi:hypothetical protein ACJVDH_19590 [Pedobacter sp. AW1-32]|uniref:hypothetical protein n=1 Tax=Pedobacter sp. AW1-32 TaxID=3383026 RepID=UPI003FF12035